MTTQPRASSSAFIAHAQSLPHSTTTTTIMPLKSPYAVNETHTIPARSGVAVPLAANQSIRVINTHGTQVVDFWCFATTSSTDSLPLTHYLSLPHTRASTCHLTPLVGDTLTTNHRSPILTLTSDTSPGVHDTLIAACDIFRYRELAPAEDVARPDYYHNNCADNCRDALLALAAKTGVQLQAGPATPPLSAKEDWTPPAPLNLWMNIPVHPKKDGAAVAAAASPSCGAQVSFERPVSKAGDEVVFRAETDCVVAMSCCPQDLLEINCGKPVSCQFEVRDA